MKHKIKSAIKQGVTLYCIIYTFTTILSSAVQLLEHRIYDTNSHILNRAVIVLIGTLTIILYDKVKFKSRIMSWLVPYAISMSIVFGYVWFTGHFEELHKNAYRDIFLNFTAITVVISICYIVKDKIIDRRRVSEDNVEG